MVEVEVEEAHEWMKGRRRRGRASENERRRTTGREEHVYNWYLRERLYLVLRILQLPNTGIYSSRRRKSLLRHDFIRASHVNM